MRSSKFLLFRGEAPSRFYRDGDGIDEIIGIEFRFDALQVHRDGALTDTLRRRDLFRRRFRSSRNCLGVRHRRAVAVKSPKEAVGSEEGSSPLRGSWDPD